MAPAANDTTRPTVVDANEEGVLVTGRGDGGIRLARLQRSSGAIDILGGADGEPLATDRPTMAMFDDTQGSQLRLGRILGTFQHQPGPECANFWYADRDYSHRIEGIRVAFDHPPKRTATFDLELALATIGGILREQTHLTGLGSTEQLLTKLKEVGSETVTFAGYDVDVRTEYAVEAQVHHGLATGRVDSIDAMQTYDDQSLVGLSHVVEMPGPASTGPFDSV